MFVCKLGGPGFDSHLDFSNHEKHVGLVHKTISRFNKVSNHERMNVLNVQVDDDAE